MDFGLLAPTLHETDIAPEMDGWRAMLVSGSVHPRK